MPVRRIATGDISLSVEIVGSGPPLLMLHGFTGGTGSMQAIVQRLQPSRTLIVPELIGHGKSDAPRDVAAYRMEACIEQLARILDIVCEDTPVDLFGYSMGGRTALAFGAACRDRTRRIAVLGASAGLLDPTERAARRASDDALADHIESIGAARFADEWAAHPTFATQRTRLTRAEHEAARQRRLEHTPHGLANSLRGMGTAAQPPQHSSLRTLDTPILLLAGEEDAKFRKIGEDLARILPHGEHFVIPQAGHAAHLENPKATARAVCEFFDSESKMPSEARP